MDPAACVARLDALLEPRPGGLELGVDEDDLVLFVRRDMLHLDADALHDRLHHWTLIDLARTVPHAHAVVSFRHAHPAEPHEESTLDAQEGWLGLEPMIRVETRRLGEDDLRRLAAAVPKFLALVEGSGRPAGFRRWDVGTME